MEVGVTPPVVAGTLWFPARGPMRHHTLLSK
jgi:hypothetical protein